MYKILLIMKERRIKGKKMERKKESERIMKMYEEGNEKKIIRKIIMMYMEKE